MNVLILVRGDADPNAEDTLGMRMRELHSGRRPICVDIPHTMITGAHTSADDDWRSYRVAAVADSMYQLAHSCKKHERVHVYVSYSYAHNTLPAWKVYMFARYLEFAMAARVQFSMVYEDELDPFFTAHADPPLQGLCNLFLPGSDNEPRRMAQFKEHRKDLFGRLNALPDEFAFKKEAISEVRREFYERCDTCAAPANLLCAKCKNMRYCSRECQQFDWRREHRHRCHPADTTPGPEKGVE